MIMKRRSFTQIMEEESIAIIREALPKEWVMHQYSPDYGIDTVIELFDYLDANHEIAETLGEVVFIQIKAVKSSEIEIIRANFRLNVETHRLAEDKADFTEIDIIKFNVDVSLLNTVLTMGQSIPVLLFVVPLDTKKVYFVCLNDYIDKLILPSDPSFHEQGTKTIYIPVSNALSAEDGLNVIRFYARRPKYYGMFQKIRYQAKSMAYQPFYKDPRVFHNIFSNLHGQAYALLKAKQPVNCRHLLEQSLPEIRNNFTELYPPAEVEATIETINMAAYLLENLLRLDTWEERVWSIIDITKLYAMFLSEGLKVAEASKSQVDIDIFSCYAFSFWEFADNLSCIYEDICREWNLPTNLACDLSSVKPTDGDSGARH